MFFGCNLKDLEKKQNDKRVKERLKVKSMELSKLKVSVLD